MSFPARTVWGEAVMIVEKVTRANQSTILVAEDGRQFEAAAGDSLNLVEVALERIEGLVEEAIETAEEVIDAAGDAAEGLIEKAEDALEGVQDFLGTNDQSPEPPAADGEATEAS